MMNTEPTPDGLASKQCVPCRGGVAPLTKSQYEPLLSQLKAWSAINGHHLEKTFQFGNFSEALAFVNRVGAVAEENGHHPDIYLSWGKVLLTIYTHKIDGLTESDFVLAAKCDALLSR
jgi:4a-hydroxytetrahydrobiopterin dehydratase